MDTIPVPTPAPGAELVSPELQMLKNNREEGYNYRFRRTQDWTENYELYRDKVTYNRLTQRQSVNLPIMKGEIRTLLKDVDDMPVIYFQNLSNDKQRELFINEYWKWTVEQNNMELQDIVDKRQVLLFGRSFDQWQIKDGRVVMTVTDPEDILVSRYVNPYDLHSARYLVHINIFVPLSTLKKNPDYNQTLVTELETWYATKNGILKADANQKAMADKNKKMVDLGVPDVDSPVLGETYVELALHFCFRDNEFEDEVDSEGNVVKGKDGNPNKLEIPTQIFLYVVAENMKTLMKKPLEKVIGPTKDHFWRRTFPYCTWADDLERQDFWSDAVGDMIRTPNKVLNSWFSQLVENRTLRNFGMHYYNSNIEGFNPQTMQPIPWGWYGIPVPTNGNLDQVMKKVDIPDLSEAIDEMQFLITITEKATGATAGQQGVAGERQITLGEFKATLVEAKERVKGMSKFYTPVWKQRGLLFIKLLEAAPEKLDGAMITKRGRNTDNMYSREVNPKDWQDQVGYTCKVWSQDEKDTNDINTLTKQNAVKAAMPDNPKVAEIYQRKLLEWADYTPDEINEIMQYEQEKRQAIIEAAQQAAQLAGAQIPGAPGTPALPAGNPTSTPTPALPTGQPGGATPQALPAGA